jgi:hypothetical protein
MRPTERRRVADTPSHYWLVQLPSEAAAQEVLRPLQDFLDGAAGRPFRRGELRAVIWYLRPSVVDGPRVLWLSDGALAAAREAGVPVAPVVRVSAAGILGRRALLHGRLVDLDRVPGG